MRYLTTTVLVLAALVVSGCVSTANVTAKKGSLSQSAGLSLAVSERPLPAFADMKPSNAMFGAIGGLASVASGNELVKKNAVADPASEIASSLSDHLATAFKVVPQSTTRIPVNTGDTKELSEVAKGKAELLLDVQTVNWSCVYLPLKWTRYRVIYSAKLRLIDVRKQEMMAEGFFVWKTPDGGTNPTYDELFENGAAGLRKQLDEARRAATDYFKVQILAEKG
jgi:hypothetical protein